MSIPPIAWSRKQRFRPSSRGLLETFLALSAFLLICIADSSTAKAQNINNGGFESDLAGWTHADSFFSFPNSSRAHAGSRYAFIGTNQAGTAPVNNVKGSIEQTIYIPNDGAYLRYWIWIASDDQTGVVNDTLKVEIVDEDGGVDELIKYSNRDGSGPYSSTDRDYQRKSFSLAAYAGQTVTVRFRGTINSDNKPTIFRVDDISIAGTIELTVNSADGQKLPKADIGSAILYSVPADDDHLQVKEAPGSNPVEFGKVDYGTYRAEVYCWDMLAGSVSSFSATTSATFKTATTFRKRPLDIFVFRDDGGSILPEAEVRIRSYNGQTGDWTERVIGTSDANGEFAIDAWPTTLSSEKYQVLVSYNGDQVGSNSNVTLPDTSAGKTIGITTSVPLSVPSNLSPGDSSGPGPTLQTVTPTLTWAAIAGVDGYGVYVRDLGTNALFKDEAISASRTSYAIPFDALEPGHSYRWYMRAKYSIGWSLYSADRFFQTPASAISITLSAPRGGETYAAGGTAEIAWSVAGDTSGLVDFKIDFAADGINFATIKTPAATERSWSWAIPTSTVSTQAKVKIRARSDHADLAAATSGAFTIGAASTNPTARPDLSNAAPEVQRSVQFDGSRSTAIPPKTLSTYEWRFDGEATTTKRAIVSRGFSAPGLHLATLTVSDSDAKTDSKSIIFLVGGGLGIPTTSKPSFGADPVNLATGNFLSQYRALNLPGRGLPFEFTLFYNSKSYDPTDAAASPGPVGYSWTHSFMMRIVAADANGHAFAVFPDGHRNSYLFDGSKYQPEAGVYDDLATSPGGGFVLTTKEQVSHQFDGGGRLTAISDRNGNAISLTYDAAGQLDSATDTVGRVIDFQYDASGRLAAIVDPLPRTFELGYDAGQNLVSVKDGRGKATTYSYDALHQMESATDPRGNVFVHNVYDNMQRVVSTQKDALLAETKIEYDFVTHVTTVTDPLQYKTLHTHDDLLRVIQIEDPLGHTEKFAYDDAHNRIKVSDKRGNETSYEYDERGNVTKKTDAEGGVTTISYNILNDPVVREDPIHRLTKWEYDAAGNLTAISDPYLAAEPTRFRRTLAVNIFGQVTSRTNANGHATLAGYDANGNLNSLTDAMGKATLSTFDAVGRKTSETNARGKTTSFAWDAGNRLLSTTFSGAGAVADRTVANTYDDGGNLKTVEDQKHRVTERFYDAKDRLIRVHFPDGSEEQAEWDPLDRRKKVIDRRGGSVEAFFDPAGRLDHSRDQMGKSASFAYDANGNATSETDADGKTTTRAFDRLNRVTSVKDHGQNETKTRYDAGGGVLSATDALLRETFFERDAAGRLVKVTGPPADPADPASAPVVEHGYDDEGNRILTKDPAGSLTYFSYDQANRRVKERTPVGAGKPDREVSYSYDEVGNLASVTNGHGTATRAYNDQNWLTGISYPNAPPVSFSHDAVGNRLTMTDAIGNTTWTYDPNDRVLTVLDPFGGLLGFGYDANGNRTSIAYPGNKVAQYTFDEANRLTGMTDWLGHHFSQSHSDAGRPVAIEYPNGTKATFGYDVAGRLNAITHAKGQGAPFAAYAYAIDPVGNITSFTADQPTPVVLLPRSDTYTYDGAGQIATLNGIAFTHDVDGNVTKGPLAPESAGNDTLSFDFENRLAAAHISGSQIDSRYDGLGHRLEATSNGTATRFLVDGTGSLAQILAEADGTGAIFAYYLYFAGLSARISADGSLTCYHGDRNGNVVALTDANGSVSDSYAYDEFGVPAGANGATPNHFRFLGRHGVYDNDDGTLYIRARNYHPDLGRFVSKDSQDGDDFNAQSVNRYTYALNNPVRMVDVSGFVAREGYANSAPILSTDSRHHSLVDYISAFADGYMAVLALADVGLGLATWFIPPDVEVTGPAMALTTEALAIRIESRLEALEGRSAIGATGGIGESALKRLGGESQVFFQTSLGKRYIDQFVEGVANESKVGYQSLTSANRLQIMKDVELMQTQQVQGSVWNFYTSPVTGKLGPSGPLRDFLNENNIPIMLHY